jgi:transposase InsO family protein
VYFFLCLWHNKLHLLARWPYQIILEDHLREWLSELDVAPMYIAPGSPWENGFVESFNGTMTNELLNREIFDTLHEAKVLLARWVRTYNAMRRLQTPHWPRRAYNCRRHYHHQRSWWW